MSTELTPREREYIACETPMISASAAILRLIAGVGASFFRAILAPSSEYNNTDSRLLRTIKEIRYTRYKKAVLRKRDSLPKKHDERLLRRLNKTPFVLAEDTYDPDAFVAEVYAEYMRNHTKEDDSNESK